MERAGREVAISLEEVREKNLMQLRKLNSDLFPVAFPDEYYDFALASGEFTKLAYYNDICVGAIASSVEKKEDGANRMYIMSVGVLPPYRGLGIGGKLLKHVLDLCLKQHIPEIYLHVMTNNEEAIKFYTKFGFEITETLKHNHVNLDHPHVFALTKFIAPSQAKK
ncbi:N-terminal acetyltransferase 50 [Hibiscus trionum]|uniref:N-terminal acetyltransferase 50 n=1 Tax=Hibiscus trionum TaxID=183268 RepID=A0A9W7MBY5_HIBTR|nr:N-terminal acetyltransferase 50 [Hibiscus trionum]